MEKSCDRKGTVWLRNRNGEVQIRTTCKVWGCQPCEWKMIALFKLRVSSGASALGRCAFITLTYRTEGKDRKDAASVAKDWKAFWRIMKRTNPEIARMKWLRVMELTKKKQPHFHVVMGPVTGKLRCYGEDDFDARRFFKRMEACGCLSHAMARAWQAVTTTSYIVFVVPVTNPRGAGAYLAKYMVKDMAAYWQMRRRGFHRRWSTSRGWPGNGRLRLIETDWTHHEFYDGWTSRRPEGAEPLSMMEMTGPPALLEAVNRQAKERKARKLRGMVNAEDVRKTD